MVAGAARDGGGSPSRKTTVAELLKFLDLSQMHPQNRRHIEEVSDHYLQLQRLDRDRLKRREREALQNRLRAISRFFDEVRAAKHS